MTTPPKRQTFAEEMELLKKQKAQAAEDARQRAAAQAQLRAQQAQQVQRTPSVPLGPSSCAEIALPPELAHMLARGKAPVPSPIPMERPVARPVATPQVQAAAASQAAPAHVVAEPIAIETPLAPQRADPKPAVFSPPIQDEAARQAREKAMAAAFAKHAPKGSGPNSAQRTAANAKYSGDMLFCTTCRCATAGEYRLPPGEGFGAFLDMVGLQYFRGRDRNASRLCTRCRSEELVPMASDVARNLCGDAYDGVMASGWAEMRRAEQVHTMERKIAIGKVMVVAVVLMGASLYAMSSPSSAVREARTQEMRQKLHAQEVERKAQSEEQEE